MNTYADDLATLVEKLDLRNAIHVGHSTGGGEVARYIGRHGTERVAKAVLIGAVPPLMLKKAPIRVERQSKPLTRSALRYWPVAPVFGKNWPCRSMASIVREQKSPRA
jgi:pimeloyl-ACP methyl ester carboxylesterase